MREIEEIEQAQEDAKKLVEAGEISLSFIKESPSIRLNNKLSSQHDIDIDDLLKELKGEMDN